MATSDRDALRFSQGRDLPVRLPEQTVQRAAVAIETSQRASYAAFREHAARQADGFDFGTAMASIVDTCDVSRIGGPAMRRALPKPY